MAVDPAEVGPARMDIDIINLSTHPDRWAAVDTQMRAVGLGPARQTAVCGTSVTLQELSGQYCQQINRRAYHKPLLPGEIGCYLSHRSAWQRLLDSGRSSLAIFEDDIEIDADLPRVLDALARSPGDWDLVKLIGRCRTESVAQCRTLTLDRNLIEYRRVPSLTSAYVISRRGAEKLLSKGPFGRPVDVDLRHWWECDLYVAGVYPYPVRRAHSSLTSTIEERRVPCDVVMRLQRLWLQAGYTAHNFRFRLARQFRAGHGAAGPLIESSVPSDVG